MAFELLKDVTIEKPSDFYAIQWQSRIYALIGLVILLVIVILSTAAIGSTDISLAAIAKMLINRLPFIELAPVWTESAETIILNIRLPRIILAGLAGAALSVAGTTYQGLFRNPLADPYLIGVAQGAGLGAIIGFLLPISWHTGVIPLLAFAGAVLAVLIVSSIARVGRSLPMTVLLWAHSWQQSHPIL